MGEPMESDEDGGSDLGEVEFQEDSPVNPEVVELLSSDDEKAAKKEVKAKNDVTTDVMEGENDITTEVVDLDAEDEKSSKAPKEKAGGSSKEKEKKKKKRKKPDVPSDESYYDSLPPKEMKYLKKNLLSEAELSQSSIVCTACYKQVNYKQEGAMMRHADLAVPVCKRCRKFYHNGEWTKDEEGYYEYCSWCAQGGDLLCCDSCPNAFCKKCIKRNLGRSKVSEIEELDKWDCLVCEPVQVYKQRAQYYSIWTYSVKEAQTEEQIKEKKEVRKNVKFVDEAHKDGMEVNKIFGNYLQKSMKSWASKCDEKVEKDDATKLVTKFRTIIKIAHHNLDLLDKQLLEGCMKSFPDVTEEELGARDMPAEKDVAEPESVKAKTNKSPKKKVKTEKPVKEEKNAKNGSNADTAASDKETNGEALAGAELELTSEDEDGDSDKKKGGLRVKSLSALLPKGMNKTSTPKKPGPASQTRKQGEKTPKKDVKGQKNGKECNGDASKDMFDDSEEEKADPKVELVLPELDEANKAARAALLNSSSDENSDKEDTKSDDSKVQSSEKENPKDTKSENAKSKSKITDDTKSKDKDKSKDKKSDDIKSKKKKSDEEEAARTALLNSSSDENADKDDSPADDSKVKSSDKEKSKDKKSDDAKSKKKISEDDKSKDYSEDDKSKDKKSESKNKKSDEDESEDKKSEDDEQAGDTKKTKEKKLVDDKTKDKKSLEEKSKDKKPVEEKSKDKKSVEEKSKDKKSVEEKSKDKKEQKGKGNPSEDDVSKNKTSEDEKTTKADSDDEFEQMANQNSDEQSDVKDEEKSDVKGEVHPSLKPKKEKSDEEDGDTIDKKDKTQKKKLKTKKELDEIKRRSVEKTADDESGSQDESKSVKEEDGSSDKPEKKKKKAAKSNGIVFSNSSEDSGEDLLGIGELSPEKKLTKKQEQQLKEKEEKKEKEKEIKKKEREEKKKAEKREKEEKKKEKRANKASDNDSDDDQLVKAVKKAKKMREKRIEKLRIKAAEIDPKIAQLSDMTVKIDVVSINEEVKKDLKENECVDVDTYPDLYTANDADDNIDDEIDKLCNFESLKGRARDRDSDGEKKDKDTKNKTNAKKKEKEAGMEDMSSGSEEVHSDEESDEEQKKTEEKSRLDLAAKFLSRSSVSSSSEGEEHSDDSTAGKEKDGKKSEKKKGEKKRKGHSSDSSDKEKKPKAKQSKLLSMKLSESESSDDDEKKYREKIERKKAEQAKKKAEKGSGDSSDSDIMTNAAKKGSAKHKLSASGKKRKRALVGSDEEENGVNSSAVEEEEDEEENSDSDSSDSDGAPKKKGKKKGKGKKKKASSSEEDSDVGERPKKKRKRIKKKGSDDSDDDDEEDEEKSPTKRVDIKKVIKDKNLEEETKEAAVVEKERRKRIEERQEKYNDLLGKADKVKEGAVVEEMILDFDEKTKETLVEVDKRLVKKLKPHQVGGIRFMWDTTFESLAQIKAGKMPGGAILAHCMGLGKTLQSVTLIHTVLANKEIGVERVMVLCPVNVVKNWAEEFDKWLIGSLELDVFEMSGQKDNWGRADVLNSWYKEGGVLICGYDMFRNLTNAKNAKYKKKQKETFARCLLDPGADLIICDEGHLLKNEKSAINAAVNKIKSPRRIVLSGTPLQNNLKEYYEMVNFVKPQLMGTRKEFMNRFVNPIVNGQHSDSTERDVKMMKKRSYLLNDLLKGCMQRLDYNVLVPYLMPKQEYVLTIELTPFQKTLYKYYLANYAKAGQIGMDGKLEGGKKGGLFYDVQNLSRVWNHPYILLLSKMRKDMTNENDESGEEGSLKDFVCDDTEESESDTSSDDFSSSGSDSSDTAAAKKKKKKAKPASKRATRADKPEELVTLDDREVVAKMSGTNAWWNQFLEEDQDLDDIMLGSKMVLLMDILKECAMMGDKVLVFSQSILSLDLIEDFLAKIHDNHEKSKKKDGVNNIDDSLETWVPGKDYYRMDGSTAADTRKVWCKYFNQATSHRMRLFLISTKAGGLGINLVAANRVIIFDASWNPSHDVQSIFRVFRFGQTKPVYIYRFLAKGTMEEKIYDRQVTKQSMSARVVDEHQIDSHFTMNDLVELYEFKDEPESARPIPMVPEDRLLAELVDKHKALVWNIHNHDSLLENKVEENLSEEERKRAWEEFENEKKGYVQQAAGNMQQQGVQHVQQMLQQQQQSINPMAIQAQLRQMYPQLSHEELMAKTRLVIMQYQQSIMEQSIMQQRQMQQQKLQQQQMQMAQQQQMQQQLAAARASAQRTIANRERTQQRPNKDVINLDDD